MAKEELKPHLRIVALRRLTQIADTVRRFTATVTSDWNGNITSVQEVIPGGMNVTSTFTYDYENRLTEYAVGGTNFSVEHTYDGYNRLVKTDATIGANTQNFEHVYSGKQHLGNIETTGVPVVGKVWKWEAGAGMPQAGPIESPQRYTASATQFYMVSDERNVERKSYLVASPPSSGEPALWRVNPGAGPPGARDLGLGPALN